MLILVCDQRYRIIKLLIPSQILGIGCISDANRPTAEIFPSTDHCSYQKLIQERKITSTNENEIETTIGEPPLLNAVTDISPSVHPSVCLSVCPSVTFCYYFNERGQYSHSFHRSAVQLTVLWSAEIGSVSSTAKQRNHIIYRYQKNQNVYLI